MTTLTLVRPPAKTQKRLFNARPSTTLTTSSTLLELKNQKYPVSPVSAAAVPVPEAVVDCQATVTLNRLELTQRTGPPGTQGEPPPATVKVREYSLSLSLVSEMTPPESA